MRSRAAVGFGGVASLAWDWLHVLVLPLAVTVAPLWLRHRDRLGRGRHLLLGLLVAAFALLVVLGYTLDLAWTGFPGNTLWDWLELLVLPLALGLLPVWVEVSQGVRPRHLAFGAAAEARPRSRRSARAIGRARRRRGTGEPWVPPR